MVDIYDGTTIVVSDAGPPGVPGRSGVGLSFSNGYHAAEILPGVVAVYPFIATALASGFVSRTKPTGIVTFILNKNCVRIGIAVMDPATCGAGPKFNGVVTLDTPTVAIVADDLIDWTAPGTVDATFTRGECTLGGPK